ncbi:MAG: macro domain-containing protein [Neisseria sp.]|nr:macro domain-containing protein [Neisseria sp.]
MTEQAIGLFEIDNKIKIVRGDLFQQDTDVLVNSVHYSLMSGSGISHLFKVYGGEEIFRECEEVRQAYGRDLAWSDAVITGAGCLPVKNVIHVVVPRWVVGNAGEIEALYDAYCNVIALAAESGLKSISFPALGIGMCRYPRTLAAAVAWYAVYDALGDYPQIEEVRLVYQSGEDCQVFEAIRRRKPLPVLPYFRGAQTAFEAHWDAVWHKALGQLAQADEAWFRQAGASEEEAAAACRILARHHLCGGIYSAVRGLDANAPSLLKLAAYLARYDAEAAFRERLTVELAAELSTS